MSRSTRISLVFAGATLVAFGLGCGFFFGGGDPEPAPIPDPATCDVFEGTDIEPTGAPQEITLAHDLPEYPTFEKTGDVPLHEQGGQGGSTRHFELAFATPFEGTPPHGVFEMEIRDAGDGSMIAETALEGWSESWRLEDGTRVQTQRMFVRDVELVERDVEFTATFHPCDYDAEPASTTVRVRVVDEYEFDYDPMGMHAERRRRALR